MNRSKRVLVAGLGWIGLISIGVLAAEAPHAPEAPHAVEAPHGAEPEHAAPAHEAVPAKPPAAEHAPSGPEPVKQENAPATEVPHGAKSEPAQEAHPAVAPVHGAEAVPAKVKAEEHGHGPSPSQGQGHAPTGTEEDPSAKSKEAASLANLTLARSFRRNQDWGQAIPLYEAYILENPNSPELPRALLELGRTYAQAGATEAALSRFYSVLDISLNQEGASFVTARELSYSAQYEIAQTQMTLGRYSQAARLFRGMHKLPLIDVDRSNIYLSCARALKLAGDKAGAAEEYQTLLQLFSDSPIASEARFELAVVLAELGRRDDALKEVLSLFERQKSSGSSDESWRYWQRRAGNQLANMFYSAGNLPEAAELYGKLLQLSGEARWRWPLLYQVGLVAEQMKDFAKAKVVYTDLAAAKAEGLPTEVAELPKLAQWRLEHLSWSERMDVELKSLKPGP
ncbi:MAG: tetratricopeptide repeat protein [Opitutaceae bacterium]